MGEGGREGGKTGLRKGNDDVKQTQNLPYHFLGSMLHRQTDRQKQTNIQTFPHLV